MSHEVMTISRNRSRDLARLTVPKRAVVHADGRSDLQEEFEVTYDV